MLKYIKSMRKKKYVKHEKKEKIVINLDHYDSNNSFHARIIENYHTMKNMEEFKKVCNY
jgi:hypothetical protein